MKILLFLEMLWPLTASAQIYKCEKQGKTSFSDEPCGDNAQVIEVKPVEKVGTKITSDSMEDLSGELHRERKQRELDTSIERQYKHIEKLADRYHKNLNDLEDELLKLRSNSYYRANTTSTAKQKMLYEKKRRIRNKISETKRRYRTDKQLAYDKLYRLKSERRKYR